LAKSFNLNAFLYYVLTSNLIFHSYASFFIQKHLVGGFNPSEKYESNGIIVPNIWKNKSHVPNNQPDTNIHSIQPWVPTSARISTQIQAFTLHATGACEALTGAQQACSEMWISPTWGLRQNEALRRFDPPT